MKVTAKLGTNLDCGVGVWVDVFVLVVNKPPTFSANESTKSCQYIGCQNSRYATKLVAALMPHTQTIEPSCVKDLSVKNSVAMRSALPALSPRGT